jgi:uncharacterized cupin superfamily protein
VETYNLFHGETTPEDDMPAGFHQLEAALGPLLGASKLGMSVYDLQPGERAWPYHFEVLEEEWLLVVSGEPTLRDPDGEQRLRAGDVVCFPTGPEGAHQVRNDTAAPVRFAMFSTIGGDANATVYPDSDKVQVRVKDVRRRVRFSPHLDYWEGEA